MKTIIFIFSLFFITLNAQKTKFDSVVTKLSKDSISYNQFREFGEIYCQKNKSNDLQDAYILKYNSQFPFPRLINFEALKMQYMSYQKQNKNKAKCTCLYLDSKNLREEYINLIKNIKNYNKEPEYDIDNYMKDYLKDFYIQIQTE